MHSEGTGDERLRIQVLEWKSGGNKEKGVLVQGASERPALRVQLIAPYEHAYASKGDSMRTLGRRQERSIHA
eukprot:1161645-Pelagomonas_calceolata.AAC.24